MFHWLILRMAASILRSGVVSHAARGGDLDLRSLHDSVHLVSNHLRVFRHWPRTWGIVRARATLHTTAQWLGQQITEASHCDRDVPRYLIHGRDGCYGSEFNCRVRSLDITQIRIPVTAPKANVFAERWIRMAQAESFNRLLILGHPHLQRVINEYVGYCDPLRPHLNLNLRLPRRARRRLRDLIGRIAAETVLGDLHHVYQYAERIRSAVRVIASFTY